ncbi:MAG TPA: NAD(P)H-dependent oxidoreductase [Candidatus Thiothrix moscowensis]|uniref:NAD(P)H-dependent oxidoreductase n=1 Tax=unclassified Thiothrix TaxID=2636184 RepID=UPI0025ED8074|nr:MULTISPECIES: NAD(P)H-dependent oxidoreductase [unclassified Thiothrix]HRJ53402.1 NAD(P)H-dependent oxidoreductase [Candidatus Thiothrix moscowensis]HRJ94621.1 NAD(P)H-dependent oxidoreductase [Candidatus Thiothrix moscowensis]
MQPFLQAMNFRHACKKFDPQQKIAEADFQQILEFGRLSPSSFGMEHWRFVVVQTPELREKLREQCWNQPQITDSSHVMVILAKSAAVEPGSTYVKQLFGRRGLPVEAEQAYLERYAAHNASEIAPYMNTFAWASKQCYIALANMMTGAASLGIDSCPIEGFSKAGVEEVLGVDTAQYGVAVVVAFGYRAGEQTSRLRQPLAELVEYR